MRGSDTGDQALRRKSNDIVAWRLWHPSKQALYLDLRQNMRLVQVYQLLIFEHVF